MKPTIRLIILALTIFIFGTVPIAHAQTAATSFTSAIVDTVICNDPPQSYSGNITQLGQIDYWEIKLAAGQKLIVDVDAEDIGKLDAYLVVLDKDENIVGMNNDQEDSVGNISLDPYLEVTAPLDDYYYIGISSASTGSSASTSVEDDRTTGPYTFVVRCSDQSSSAQLKWPVEVGDLLGATGSDTGSLISISPENANASPPVSLGVGPICDIEFDPSSELIFVAVDAVDSIEAADSIPGRIVAINPDSGQVVESYSLETQSVVALEAAEDKLYVVRVDPSGENFTLSLVTFDTELKTANLTDVASLGRDVGALAYNRSEKIMYAARGENLIKFDLSQSPIDIQQIGSPGLGEIVALDFDPNNTLYAVNRTLDLFEIPDLTLTEQPTKIGPINSTSGVSGLTFVVGGGQDVEPIKTVCSSTLTGTNTASSGTDIPQLTRMKLKKNPLHRAIGLFKFQGTAGEKVTLRLAPEEEEAVVMEDKSSLKRLVKSWLANKSKGRVFLGIRDVIPNVDFRVRKKDQLPFDMSAELPENGYYYIMVIRPLLRFYQTDYCLTLESNQPDSQAWRTLEVVLPGDDSEEDTPTLTEAKTAEFQSAEVSDEGSPGSENTTFGEITGELPPPTGSEPVSIASATIAPEPVDGGRGPELPIEEETMVNGAGEVAPAEQPAAEPTMKGAPAIPEETTVDQAGQEVAPGEPAAQVSGNNESVAGSDGSVQATDDYNDGVGSSEGDNSNVVEEDPPEASKL
jgi:hypothetical protein